MKKIFSLFAAILMVGSMMAATSVYEHTFSTTDKTFTADGAATLSDVSWTLATTWVGDNKDYNRDTNSPSQGMKLGSNSKAIQTMTLTTSGISGVIDSIYFETNARSGAAVAMSVTVGGTAYTGPASFNGTGAFDTRSKLTYKGNSTGEIVLSWDETAANASKKGAFYLTVLKVYSHTEAPATGWDGTVTLSKTTFTSLADLEGLQLTFNGATSISDLGEDADGLYFQNAQGNKVYAVWGPLYGGTYTVDGNTITLNGWMANDPLPAESGSVYFEDYGVFVIDGTAEYLETIEAQYVTAGPTTYTVTYTVNGFDAEHCMIQAGYFNEGVEGDNFVAGENTVPENMSAYVYVTVIDDYTVEVKVNGAVVTLTDGYWDGAITADMTIEVTFTEPQGEQSAYASIYTSNVTFTAGTNSYLTDKISIDGTEYDAFKIGTSKAAGSCSVTLPKGTTAFHFHAICWSKTADTDLNITGAYTETVVIKAANIFGNSPYTFDLTYADPTKRFYSHTFDTELAEEATVTFSCSYRAVFFGVNVEGNFTPTAVENVEAAKTVKVIENGQVVIIREGVRYNVAGQKL